MRIMSNERRSYVVSVPAGQAEAFVLTIGRFPSLEIQELKTGKDLLSNTESGEEIIERSVIIDTEMDWEEELNLLKAYVEKVRVNMDIGNPIVDAGFRSLRSEVIDTISTLDMRYSSGRDRSFRAFAKDTIDLFGNSVEQYARFSTRPSIKNRLKVIKYKRSGDSLTPREIRVLIGMYGLDGKKPIDMQSLSDREGLQTISGARDTAHARLIWCLVSTKK